jgi:hypothetical protein
MRPVEEWWMKLAIVRFGRSGASLSTSMYQHIFYEVLWLSLDISYLLNLFLINENSKPFALCGKKN